jgi:hypothetical protein
MSGNLSALIFAQQRRVARHLVGPGADILGMFSLSRFWHGVLTPVAIEHGDNGTVEFRLKLVTVIENPAEVTPPNLAQRPAAMFPKRHQHISGTESGPGWRKRFSAWLQKGFGQQPAATPTGDQSVPSGVDFTNRCAGT